MDKSEGYFELSCDIRIVLTNEETEIKKKLGKRRSTGASAVAKRS
jgi:hypothetical protein